MYGNLSEAEYLIVLGDYDDWVFVNTTTDTTQLVGSGTSGKKGRVRIQNLNGISGNHFVYDKDKWKDNQ